MRYLMLIAGDEGDFEALPEDQRSDLYERISAFWNDHAAAGRIVDGAELEPSVTATTVRMAPDGRTSVSDGPFVEAKEMIGGYAILDVEDLDEAIRVASGWPERGHEAVLEIRPIVER